MQGKRRPFTLESFVEVSRPTDKYDKAMADSDLAMFY